jgi:hypothetical protein
MWQTAICYNTCAIPANATIVRNTETLDNFQLTYC